ncbi:microfibril-associated glycoprotein 4-like [Ruditapes philippinarum]|uniref:microfibril-associated glycoprotein 4-like n=1 Tax=Ruditapes philippinarum TaxID=129788 RepID=UPI00295A6C1E|nr:microfibril-associated glycoprotein 4-like [Ruditapes philippinarum]
MQLFGKVSVLLFGVYVFGLTSSTKEFDRLKLRVKHLETRLNNEFSFRDEDIAEITGRLDDIDEVLNATVGKEQPIPAASTAGGIDFKTVDTLKEDFARLRGAFTKEKTETVMFRRKIPKIENNLISLTKDVKDYCEVAVNNTDQLITSFGTIKKAAEEKILMSANDCKVLQSISEQVQLNTDNNKAMAKQFESIKTLITNSYSHIGYLIQGPSCRSLRVFGNLQNGIYNLGQGIDVYCDQTTDVGDWIVFQRRLNGKTDFYRTWTAYKNGFGDLNGEFWLGNDHLSLLTSNGEHELRIEFEDFKGNRAYSKYSKFKIYPEEDNYKLEISGYSGTAGDSLEYHNGMMFSTYDRDNDIDSAGNCAKMRHGAWWYGSCQFSNLNGKYYNQPGKIDSAGITWYHWKDKYYSLKKVEMKFR